MEYVVSVAALLIAVWCLLVRYPKVAAEHEDMRRRLYTLEDVVWDQGEIAGSTPRVGSVEARLRALEEDAAEREKVWRSIVTIENDQPWKDLDLLRSGGPKPEVKNVEGKP